MAQPTVREHLPDSEEMDLLLDRSEKYWRDFGKLVARHVERTPAHLRDYLLMLLQERSSVYGSDFDTHLNRRANYRRQRRHT